MSFLGGLAVFFAGLSVFLALALIGALVQRRALIAQLDRARADDGLRPFAGKLVLLVSEGCPACAAALGEVDAAGAAGEVVVLSAGPLASRPNALVDIDLWQRIYPGFTPCALRVDAQGRPGDVVPVNSQAAMRSALRGLVRR